MSPTTANKALVRRYIEQIWNRGDLAAIEQLVAEGFAGHDPATRGEPRGQADLHALINTYRTALPDVHITVDQQVAEGDWVVTRWTACGTHRGRLWAIGPTGRRVAVSGLSLHRVRADKLTEEWTSFDALGARSAPLDGADPRLGRRCDLASRGATDAWRRSCTSGSCCSHDETGCSSYFVASRQSRGAAVIDPLSDVQRYLDLAAERGYRCSATPRSATLRPSARCCQRGSSKNTDRGT